MGYACPVCGTPQADATHLADHLAFCALLGRADHEAWLDEHAPDWAAGGTADLAPVVADHADEVEFEPVFEDTAHDHDATGEHHHAGRSLEDELARHGGYGRGSAAVEDPETRRILEEAQEMTRQMYGGGDGDGDPAAGGRGDDGGDEAQDEGGDAPDEAESE